MTSRSVRCQHPEGNRFASAILRLGESLFAQCASSTFAPTGRLNINGRNLHHLRIGVRIARWNKVAKTDHTPLLFRYEHRAFFLSETFAPKCLAPLNAQVCQ